MGDRSSATQLHFVRPSSRCGAFQHSRCDDSKLSTQLTREPCLHGDGTWEPIHECMDGAWCVSVHFGQPAAARRQLKERGRRPEVSRRWPAPPEPEAARRQAQDRAEAARQSRPSFPVAQEAPHLRWLAHRVRRSLGRAQGNLRSPGQVQERLHLARLPPPVQRRPRSQLALPAPGLPPIPRRRVRS